jgi:hypothetical protein
MNGKSESRPAEKQASTALAAAIPPDVLELLGRPPLLSTEDAKLYYAMLASIAQAIRPTDVITWLLIKDLTDHRVEIARYRRFKTDLVEAARRKQIRDAISGWTSEADSVGVILRREAEERKHIIAKSNKTAAEIEQLKQDIDNKVEAKIAKKEAEAQSAIQYWRNVSSTENNFVELFDRWISRQEQIEDLLQTAEERFSATLDELDRHVRGLGRFVREERDVIEGEVIASSAPGQPSSVQPMPRDSKRVSGHHRATPRTIPLRKSLARRGTRRLARGSR